jgi:hypothetical protein
MFSVAFHSCPRFVGCHDTRPDDRIRIIHGYYMVGGGRRHHLTVLADTIASKHFLTVSWIGRTVDQRVSVVQRWWTTLFTIWLKDGRDAGLPANKIDARRRLRRQIGYSIPKIRPSDIWTSFTAQSNGEQHFKRLLGTDRALICTFIVLREFRLTQGKKLSTSV